MYKSMNMILVCILRASPCLSSKYTVYVIPFGDLQVLLLMNLAINSWRLEP
jgi:hypothetical protein